jgi:inorganic pyrophosphatase
MLASRSDEFPAVIEVVVEIPRRSRNKLLEDKTVQVLGWRDEAEARKVVVQDRVRAR